MVKRSIDSASKVYLNRQELRELWESNYGALDDTQRRRFEERPEIPFLIWIPMPHVKSAVMKAWKLQKILQLARESYEAEVSSENQKREVSLRAQVDSFVVKKPRNPSRQRIN